MLRSCAPQPDRLVMGAPVGIGYDDDNRGEPRAAGPGQPLSRGPVDLHMVDIPEPEAVDLAWNSLRRMISVRTQELLVEHPGGVSEVQRIGDVG